MSNDQERKPNVIVRLWRWFWGPAGAISLGVLLVGGFIAGIIFWGGFHTAMEMTNNEEFCISCHEMENNVYAEYAGSVHDQNASGVRATCPDCHVPHEWQHKIVRKIRATNELWHKALGSIDTREKFEEKRLELAQNVWRSMEETDSRECRNCHNFEAMDVTLQPKRARENHLRASEEGLTCINCHKGIAHELPKGAYGINPELVFRHATPQADAKPEG